MSDFINYYTPSSIQKKIEVSFKGKNNLLKHYSIKGWSVKKPSNAFNARKNLLAQVIEWNYVLAMHLTCFFFNVLILYWLKNKRVVNRKRDWEGLSTWKCINGHQWEYSITRSKTERESPPPSSSSFPSSYLWCNISIWLTTLVCQER